MIGKEVFFGGFMLLICLTESKCQKLTADNVTDFLNGSIECDFSLKYKQVIEPAKLNLTWYNKDNFEGTSYSLVEASENLIKSSIFWRYPSLNIYVSGYGLSSRTADSNMIRDAFLFIEEPIILLDYSAYCGTDDPGYVDAALSIHNIGEIISQFLIDMVDAGVATGDIHLMGMSLGGQLVGTTARAFRHYYGANLGRVTGLDPAGPCFDRASKDENLKKEDAHFVDIYNSNRGQLGTVQILGHANFLVNGGGPKQEPCERLVLMKEHSTYSMQCAHAITSVEYWKRSIMNGNTHFNAILCDNLDQAVRQACVGEKICSGYGVSPSTRGIYYVPFDYSVSLAFSEAALTELLSAVEMVILSQLNGIIYFIVSYSVCFFVVSFRQRKKRR